MPPVTYTGNKKKSPRTVQNQFRNVCISYHFTQKKNKKEKIYNHFKFPVKSSLQRPRIQQFVRPGTESDFLNTTKIYQKCQFCFVAKNKIK